MVNSKSNNQTRSKEFVLALGSGGGRGLAHLGVLKTLEEHNLKPVAIIGTSIGALFGSMYALTCDAETVIVNSTTSPYSAFNRL